MNKTLIVIVGPTAVGKSDLSIDIAKHFDAPIVSSDSRQIYKEMNIGTAVPTKEQLEQIKHYFIQTRSITEDYTAGMFENDALEKINELFKTHNYILLTGGSGLYIDALCDGIDNIPIADKSIREGLIEKYNEFGIDYLTEKLLELDETYYNTVDLSNRIRVMRALEVCLTTGKTYSELRIGEGKKRDFKIIKIGLTIDRDILYQRINQRVDMMVEQGLIEEAQSLYPFRKHNALQTVGYKEFFDYFDDKITKEEAIEILKRNTRRYAKRQMTWFRRYKEIQWFSPKQFEKIISLINLS